MRDFAGNGYKFILYLLPIDYIIKRQFHFMYFKFLKSCQYQLIISLVFFHVYCKERSKSIDASEIISFKTGPISYVIETNKGSSIYRYKSPQEGKIYEKICEQLDPYKIGWSCEFYNKLDSLSISDTTLFDRFDVLEMMCYQFIMSIKSKENKTTQILKVFNSLTENSYSTSHDPKWNSNIETFFNKVVDVEFPKRKYKDVLDVCEKEKLRSIKNELIINQNAYQDSTIYLCNLKSNFEFAFEEDRVPLYIEFLKMKIKKDSYGTFIELEKMYISFRSYFVNMPIRFDKGEGYEL